MVCTFPEKNSASCSGVANNKIKQNLKSAEELHKPTIRNFLKKSSLFKIQRQYLGC